jgi:hypothetical protein
MIDQDEQQESPAQRLLREKREREATDLTGNERDEQQESSDRQLSGAGSNEPLGRVLNDEETPSNVLPTDGSRSPHDASSEGGSRQAHAHKQLADEQKKNAEREATLRGAGAPNAVNVAPSEAQAASGAAAQAEGRAE